MLENNGRWAPEIARLYNFPPGLDGRGQTIGIFEFRGAIIQEDVNSYFRSLNLPVPRITAIQVTETGLTENQGEGNASSQSTAKDEFGMAQVMLDIEVLGSIAPKADLRIYFIPLSGSGWLNALRRAIADRVSIISIGQTWNEAHYKEVLNEVNTAPENAAGQGITVVAGTGDNGVSYGYHEGRHVAFPGSSPWVLSVGGTTLNSAGGRITSEVVWNNSSMGTTGGGFSEMIPPPREPGLTRLGKWRVAEIKGMMRPNASSPERKVEGRSVVACEPLGAVTQQCAIER